MEPGIAMKIGQGFTHLLHCSANEEGPALQPLLLRQLVLVDKHPLLVKQRALLSSLCRTLRVVCGAVEAMLFVHEPFLTRPRLEATYEIAQVRRKSRSWLRILRLRRRCCVGWFRGHLGLHYCCCRAKACVPTPRASAALLQNSVSGELVRCQSVRLLILRGVGLQQHLLPRPSHLDVVQRQPSVLLVSVGHRASKEPHHQIVRFDAEAQGCAPRSATHRLAALPCRPGVRGRQQLQDLQLADLLVHRHVRRVEDPQPWLFGPGVRAVGPPPP
mmetsp:Transcript_9034/g.33227  ORF Transcript_9034/g.33227 Transcript_9034/m.33227 type:complete len:273 (-) Transcript_9034:147-965(-)